MNGVTIVYLYRGNPIHARWFDAGFWRKVARECGTQRQSNDRRSKAYEQRRTAPKRAPSTPTFAIGAKRRGVKG